MEQQEITLGQVTYQVSRVYTGTRSASELVAERLVKRLSENPPLTKSTPRSYNGLVGRFVVRRRG